MTIPIYVFVEDPQAPGEVAATAIARARAAAQRSEGRAQVRVLALSSPEAANVGAAIEPTVAVGDLVLATGQAPSAGHLLRAVNVALQGDE